MYTEQEIKIANATSRSRGASVFKFDGTVRAVVPQYVAQHMDKDKSILDFGAGKNAVHTVWLREQGFENVTAYDFGSNIVEGLHDTKALSKQFNTVFASNVINTCSSAQMLTETLQQMWNCVEPGGRLIVNYPSSPRKLSLGTATMNGYMQAIFHSPVINVASTNSAPVWRITKQNDWRN